MSINNALDKLVNDRQEKCSHPYQDRIVTVRGIFCGRCGKEEEVE